MTSFDKKRTGLIADTVATLEGIPRVDRGKYFAGQAGGHPGLAAVLRDRLEEARKLGFQLLRTPRIGLDVPSGLDDLYFAEANDAEQAARQTRTFAAIRAIEGRGVGKDHIEAIGRRIATRLNLTGPWNKFLGRPANAQENDEIADAIGEWADEDALAAHVGYQHDLFCSDDMGKTASKALGDSILTPANRAWLTSALSIQFVTLSELASRL